MFVFEPAQQPGVEDEVSCDQICAFNSAGQFVFFSSSFSSIEGEQMFPSQGSPIALAKKHTGMARLVP